MLSPLRPGGRGQYLGLLLSLGDLAIVNLLFWLTISVFPGIKSSAVQLRELWLLVTVSYLPAMFWSLRSPQRYRAIRMDGIVRTALFETALHALVFLALVAFLHITVIPWEGYIFYYALMMIAIPLFMVCALMAVKSYRRRGYNYNTVVIIGTGVTARRLYDAMQGDTGFGYRVLGFFDDFPDEGFDLATPMPMEDLAAFVEKNHVREMFFTLSGHNSALSKAIKVADDHVITFYYVPQIPRTLPRRFALHSIGTLPVLAAHRNPLQNAANRFVKRAFDLVVSSLFLLVYPLIYVPIAIAIKMSSPGPVYFRQERTGYLGRSFTCLKFRTMRVNSEADKLQASENDPRKTSIGDFLRKTSLDELPQFINVWKGDMSIIGPRPHMLKHTEDYTRLVDSYMVRHAVKPGITGWAQVNGYRGITDEVWKMERRVEHDVWYIENWTFLLDLKIMVRTVMNAFFGDKNAF